MVYKIEKLTRDVRVALDENKVSGELELEGDVDTLGIDEIIRSKVSEAALRVIKIAPAWMTDGGKPVGDAVSWQGSGPTYWGRLLLPDDFMRLLAFKMSDWERSAQEVLSEEDPRYGLQHSRYSGLRGNPQKPVVAIVRRQEGLMLEFYSCLNKDATIEQGVYLSVPRLDRYGMIDIPEKCYKAVIYEAASLTSATIGEIDMSRMLGELSRGLLEG